MARDYIVRPRSADFDKGPDGEHYLAREIIETVETIDIGITDQFGNKIMARSRMDPVGFVRFPEK